MTQVQLAIHGISGRMGQTILELANEFKITVTGGTSRNSSQFKSGGVAVSTVKEIESLDARKTDVLIDFALPESSSQAINWCLKNKKPFVSGVTGLSPETKNQFVEAAQQIPVLWAPNMSLGIAVVSRMLAALHSLEGFDFQIEELHHTRKKDSPSGTALFLQENLLKAVGKAAPPLSIRGGGVFGIHKVWAMGEEEVITIEHTAMNRRVFARGALRAASWIVSQPAGLYSMDDVL